jgi:precorrin-6Y C5,15-methyltransferase (decarboxylating) CbiT subunit
VIQRITQEYEAPGLPDDLFIRGEIPMTKQEIRWLALCKARVEPLNCIWDIGAGTGSISVEAARLTPKGVVYAVDKSIDAISLIEKNALRFHTPNLTAVLGSAPEVLSELPDPDRIFIGGSGGAIELILQCCINRIRPGGVIILTAITADTIYRAFSYLRREKWQIEGIMVQINRLVEIKDMFMWKALNPIQILVATKEGANAAW